MEVIAMKRTLIILLLTALAIPAATAAQVVTHDEARTVAENWIAMTMELRGDWGGLPSAAIGEIEELRRDGRLLGYWCHIEPEGHIIVSLVRGLPPVTAYSATWDGDPSCDADIVDIIKFRITTVHEYIEAQIGPVETASPEAIERLAEFSYRDTWLLLSRNPSEFMQELQLLSPLTNYQQYQVMLITNWSQSNPYNLFCPEDEVCTAPHYDGRCATGCVATAAAQIMKYWCWPPYGSGFPYNDPYYWTYMPDSLSTSSPQYQIEAVANLMSEIGLGCLMDYCRDNDCGSGAFPEDMVDAYENYFRFDTDLHILYKDDYGNAEWFELIKEQLDVNRPLHYGITGHSVVVDGYQHVMDIRMYHINYGWGGGVQPEACWDPYRETGSNTWFMVYGLPCAVETDMIAGIQPDVSLDALLGPIYGNNPSFPYRYVNVDATGNYVTFSAGQLIQFLPGIDMMCTSTTGGAIKIFGEPALHTRLFTRGDITKGVKIENGGIALYGGGGVRMY
jgi:hypothetical protein